MKPLSKPFTLSALSAALALTLTAAPTWGAEKAWAKSADTPSLQAALPALSELPSPTLPQIAAVDQILAETPALQEAQALQQAAAQNGAVLRAGTNEFTGQAQVQQRRIESAPDSGRYNEWQLLINRQLRLPSQAQADGRMAEALQTSAQAALVATRQQFLGALLTAWFAAQRAQAEAALAQQDLDLIDAQVKALQRRQSLGDASVLELEQMQAEQARARSTLLRAQGVAASSRAALLARYPALSRSGSLQGQTDPGALALPSLNAEQLSARAVQASPLLLQQRAMLQKAQAMVAQAHAARTPQPTVGAYIGSDRGGSERIVGLQFAMPFGGPARESQERAALAEADAAQWRLRDLQAQVEADFQRLYADAQAQEAAVKATEQAAQVQTQASNRMLRAYQLGEVGVSDWLLARRNALESAKLVLQSRFDAATSSAQLKLQTGLLYELTP
ncbi:putative Integral outer membrane protein TolC, efflux pump component [Thiomonas arsenitoxydans]|uniref:Integral outer membrane protein TolC, efflux pump component n=1 Tax=Thiomonas arsenitoxydans (strain DSM 22701 / CIP 110005 / 3As) TaxID=426114 RepID=D6CKU5_THIA3|nr:TolC family protein [Thiomonas arsenitoxydans]CAZ87563.1 putative Integral outer membrane protein TolC, efflux pump component [Thiomonas arsenitoxydans]CQR27078.1 putative Integral outer membrane protein TolC, efflux pump component [Thiomonas arsenitoxydans]CQR29970.1 putative Integral outer membrane protein TolC, efflux pump component [Thiomonas arsenitoxydans]CQR29979.1 putative Integral outer membrane protein TolC, efflux pump component [Thiomonas arsenitoxydans]CQR32561.1 putative Integ